MMLTVKLDLDGSLAEDDVLAGIGLSNPNGPGDPDEWFPYPTKTVSIVKDTVGSAY